MNIILSPEQVDYVFVVGAENMRIVKKDTKDEDLLQWFCFLNGHSFSQLVAAAKQALENMEESAKKEKAINAIKYWEENKKNFLHVFLMKE